MQPRQSGHCALCRYLRAGCGRAVHGEHGGEEGGKVRNKETRGEGGKGLEFDTELRKKRQNLSATADFKLLNSTVARFPRTPCRQITRNRFFRCTAIASYEPSLLSLPLDTGNASGPPSAPHSLVPHEPDGHRQVSNRAGAVPSVERRADIRRLGPAVPLAQRVLEQALGA